MYNPLEGTADAPRVAYDPLLWPAATPHPRKLFESRPPVPASKLLHDRQSDMSPSRPNRRERRRAETRERIFRAALKLFAARGVLATTVEDITEAADVGKGTFFNYFPSKEHVLLAFGEMQAARARKVLDQSGRQARSLEGVLRRLGRVLAAEPGRSPALARNLLGALLMHPELSAVMRRNMDRAQRLLLPLMAEGQRRGELRRDSKPAELARHFLHNFFGTVMLWTLHPGRSLAARWNDMFDLVWAGIAAPRKSPEVGRPA